VIPARFSGFCRNCRHRYERGDLIRKAADKVWIHDTCPNGEPQSVVIFVHDGSGTRLVQERVAGGPFLLVLHLTQPSAPWTPIALLWKSQRSPMMLPAFGRAIAAFR
jgi:hypothetical protein